MSNRILIVQEIGTRWTKASRGGPGAVKRNAVPLVAAIPIERFAGLKSLPVVQHRLSFTEWGGFTEPRETLTLDDAASPVRLGGVTVSWTNDEVEASFAWNARCGAPDRGWIRKTLVAPANAWVQIVYNGRFTDHDDGRWSYARCVINAGLFDSLSRDIFTQREPIARFSAEAILR